MLRPLLLIPLLAAGVCAWSAEERSIFDGTTLGGWEGDAKWWRVEDGALTGEIPAGQSLGRNQFLFWKGESRDFDLTVEYRISGVPSANSGIQIRSQRLDDGEAKGYQADLDDGATWLGRIYEENGRALLAERGTRGSIAPDGRRWADPLATPESFRSVPVKEGWNTYHVHAANSHLETWINGTLFAALDDHQSSAAKYAGRIGLQLHAGPGPAKIQFRNIRFTDLGASELPPALPGVQDVPATASAGIRPLGDDGKPLNLDFETGTLAGWTATGDAFTDQPIKGDTISQRKPGMASRHAGQFWIGGYEHVLDAGTGTLTSPAFVVAQPWASFLVGGGRDRATLRVELVEEGTGKVVFTGGGNDLEDMQRVAVDLTAWKGKHIRIRLVDQATGGWGHLNFDDFVFHDQKPSFAASTAKGAASHQNDSAVLWHLRPNPAKPTAIANPEAQKLISDMMLTHGFQAELMVAEPDVRQPIAFAIDERGRLWVVEAYSYPNKQPEGKGKDRIVIFEDKDGDGFLETRTVFTEGLNLVSGIEVGYGGVFIGAAPQLLFIPDRDHDDKPDGAPEVVLDGWGHQDTHETMNSFTWGPDGWLYGNQGVFTRSNVGKPGATDAERTPLRAGVWRYHPVRKEFEVFAHGGSNQWGIDFNEVGHLFMTHCRSFWGGGGTSYVIRNGHYWNQVNAEYAPFIDNNAPDFAPALRNYLPASARYDDGEGGAGKPGSGAVYGGHAHAGAMIYLGDNWPEIYRDHMFTFNLFGQQLNHQESVRSGAGYETLHAGYDMLMSPDPRWLGVDLQYGPDGAAYAIDWCDTQHCHTPRDESWNRSDGRIYRISWAATWHPVKVDLGAKTDAELVALHAHRNEWFVRTARRLLAERAATGKLDVKALAPLRTQASAPDAVTALHALWTLHVTGQLDAAGIAAALKHPDDRVRGWAVDLGTERAQAPLITPAVLTQLATSDPSPAVRLALASALPTLADAPRWDVAKALAAHGEDAGDRFLPKVVWTGLAPLVPGDPTRALALAAASPLPTVSDSCVWYAARSGAGRDQITAQMSGSDDARAARLLRLLASSLENETRLPMPAGWADVAKRFAKDDGLRALSERLSAVFGDNSVLARMRGVLGDDNAPAPERQRAFELLKRSGDKEAQPIYVHLLEADAWRTAVIPLLAGSADPAAAKGIIAHFAPLSEKDRIAALETLTSHPAQATELLHALQDKRFDRANLTALHVRQMRNLHNDGIDQLLDKAFGRVTDSPAAAKATMARFKKTFNEAPLWAFDVNVGKAVFQRTCTACHSYNGVGGKLGPDLGGSARNGVDYFIENIVDPNAVVGENYQLNLITKKDGSVVSGMVDSETDTVYVLRTVAEKVIIPKDQVQTRQVLAQSMMPPGLLEAMPEPDVIALLKFLTNKN